MMKNKTKNKLKNQNQNQNFEPLEQGMSIIVKTVTRLTVGILFVYGINVALHGHIIPGGGFAGGAIIALALLNVVLAFGKDAALEKLSHTWAIILTTLGLLLFMVIGLFSVRTIPLLNIAICLQVAAGIFAIFICLVSLKQEIDKP